MARSGLRHGNGGCVLAFLTAVRHPDTTSDFSTVEALLERTLRSICQQEDPRFVAIVTSNVVPRIRLSDPRVVFHIVDFPPPFRRADGTIPLGGMLRDKGMRLLSAALLARRFLPDHFAFVDSDDLVSRRLSRFTNADVRAPGWYVDDGYVLDDGRRRVQRKSGLVRYCGSSLLPNATELLRIADVAPSLDEYSSPDALSAAVSEQFIETVIGDHRAMVPLFAARGLRMQAIPFRSACWVRSTGANYSSSTSRANGVPLSAAFCQEFGLDRSLASTTPASWFEAASESANALLSRLGAFKDSLV